MELMITAAIGIINLAYIIDLQILLKVFSETGHTKN